MKKFLFIPGLPRCATTSFVQVLGQHPNIFLPKMKEPHFFLRDREQFYLFDKKGNKIPFGRCGFINSEKEFNKNYNQFRDNGIFIDGSTLYSVHPESINQIAAKKDIDPYFIILKRDPFKRAVSHYLYSISRGEEFRSFEEALADERNKKYSKWLLGGYIRGSSLKECEEKIKFHWGTEKLIVADIDNEKVFSKNFMSAVIKLLDLKSFDFNYNIQSNNLVYTENKTIQYLRICFKKARQRNPLMIDNKVTRFLFERFMKLIPDGSDVYRKYEQYKDLYSNYFGLRYE
jgi:hypothetical protein